MGLVLPHLQKRGANLMQGCRPLSDDEITSMRTALQRGKFGSRDDAMFVFGLNTGFRVSELLALTRADVLDEFGKVPARIQVARRHMKGRTASRTVLLNQAAREAVTRWLIDSAQRGHIHGRDPLFCTLAGGRMSRFHAYRIIRRAAARAKVGGRVATHSMRKTFANSVYDYFLAEVARGVQIDPFRATSRALGHAAITSTDKYLRFRTEDVDQAIAAISAHTENRTSREQTFPDCPRCKNNRQVWVNQLSGVLTCHRAGCQTEVAAHCSHFDRTEQNPNERTADV